MSYKKKKKKIICHNFSTTAAIYKSLNMEFGVMHFCFNDCNILAGITLMSGFQCVKILLETPLALESISLNKQHDANLPYPLTN